MSLKRESSPPRFYGEIHETHTVVRGARAVNHATANRPVQSAIAHHVAPNGLLGPGRRHGLTHQRDGTDWLTSATKYGAEVHAGGGQSAAIVVLVGIL